MSQFGSQVIAVPLTVVYAGGVTFILFKAVDALIGLRVDIEEESMGLDLTQHGESTYNE